MPGKRKVKRTRRKRRNWMKTGARVASIAYDAYKGVQFIKSIVNAEKHYYDNTGTVTATNAGTITCLNNIAAGVDVMNRIGNSILAKRISGAVTCELNTTGSNAQFVRVMLIQDILNQGIDPTLSELLQNTSDVITSPINVDNTPRFWVLYNKVMVLDDYNLIRYRKIFKRLNFHIKYSGTSNAYGHNSVYLVVLSDEPTNGPAFTYDLRLAYYDN